MTEFSDKIIEFFAQNPDIKGDTFINMSVKDLRTKLSTHCESKKVNGIIPKFRKILLEQMTKPVEPEIEDIKNDQDEKQEVVEKDMVTLVKESIEEFQADKPNAKMTEFGDKIIDFFSQNPDIK